MNSAAAHHLSGPSAPPSRSSSHRKTGAHTIRTIVIAFGSCRGMAMSPSLTVEGHGAPGRSVPSGQSPGILVVIALHHGIALELRLHRVGSLDRDVLTSEAGEHAWQLLV